MFAGARKLSARRRIVICAMRFGARRHRAFRLAGAGIRAGREGRRNSFIRLLTMLFQPPFSNAARQSLILECEDGR
ncbi:hypothetical protein IE4872_CH02126 [Rhizobium gallicum]|uniref:Uncharacterized protein n=1 Tax=Rhizobium gallicum TaxID=56730 RepID=A0A1L5NIP9_9HYPH|nr:hypothetical protein IE4872_CH02126 [Rhizobium gallicum]